ncbi:hypothetical protein [Rhodospirillum sp. A1_3_36]|uniref:hypothetical protein n=1 Tax=Rhodospirillum sp. A1_3_36 TaxID=3391666 RepID=UPI0039A703F6
MTTEKTLEPNEENRLSFGVKSGMTRAERRDAFHAPRWDAEKLRKCSNIVLPAQALWHAGFFISL